MKSSPCPRRDTQTGRLGPRGGQEGCGAPGAGGAARAQASGCSGDWREEGAVEGLTAPRALGHRPLGRSWEQVLGAVAGEAGGGGRWRLGPA